MSRTGKHLALVIDLQPGGPGAETSWVLLMLNCPPQPCEAPVQPALGQLHLFYHVLGPFGDLSFSSYDIAIFTVVKT